MIEVINFKKEYLGNTILFIPELRINGPISWFKGVNGSGKSTFFKALSGIIPFEGKIVFKEVIDLVKEPLKARSMINYAYAEPVFPAFLSGKDILEYCTKTNRGSKAELNNYAEIFEIKDWYHKSCGSYSSGMNKKISLIAAFLGSPQILALDEPLTTVDASSQKIVARLIFERKQQNLLTLIASHQNLDHLLETSEDFVVENQTIQKTK